jgi:hypothetical protein
MSRGQAAQERPLGRPLVQAADRPTEGTINGLTQKTVNWNGLRVARTRSTPPFELTN